MRSLNLPGRPRDAALTLAGMVAGASMAVVALGAPPALSTPKVAAPVARAARPSPPERAAVAPSQPMASDPVRLLIPSIGVDSAVEPVGLAGGAMDVPKAAGDVGWYRDGVRLGAPGDSVIDGHLDWTTGPAVFWRLSEVKPGDRFRVLSTAGSSFEYQVFDVRTVPYNRPPPDLFAVGGPPRLSLITCAGAWDSGRQIYNQRLVVEAVQLAVN